MQDVQGFVPYVNDLKINIFKFHEKLRNYTDNVYQKMIQREKDDITNKNLPNLTTVSIHIRLTDFGSHLKGFWNITYAQPEYFSNAMRYFTERYQVNIRRLLNE